MEVAKSYSKFEESQLGLSRKSSSEEEESNAEVEEEEVPDYVDKAGRRWHILCHAKEDLAQFAQQNGLVPGNENGKRRKFGCSRPECHFRAVFLKTNSGIYTRGEHWHNQQIDGSEVNGRKNSKSQSSGDNAKSNERILCSLSKRSKIICREKEEIFIGINGTELKLVRRFETDEEFEGYRRENWLRTGGKYMKCNDRMYLRCRRGNAHQNKLSTNCRVRCVYVKRNRSLYQNNQQHNHPMGKEHEVNYVDRKGQHWQCLRQIQKMEELKNFANDQMLFININREKLVYFKCKYANNLKRHAYPPPYCQMRAVFIKATSSIYVRNEHSHHPAFKLRIRRPSSHHFGAKLYNEVAGFFEAKNEEGNVPIPKQEEADSGGEGEEVRIVKHLQRDYKCLGQMKREGEAGQSRTSCWAVQTVQLEEEDMDLEEGTSQGTRERRGRSTFYRYTQRKLQRPIKKEEPAEEAREEEEALELLHPRMPPRIAIQMPQWLLQPQPAEVAQPAKMLLRERKERINYGK